MKFWFLSYIIKNKATSPDPNYESTANIVIAGVHPLVWLSTPGEVARMYNTSIALHFHEIDEATFDEVVRLNYIGHHDQRLVTAAP